MRAAAEIREAHPNTGVLVLSAYIDEGPALELLSDSAEGLGYLLKDRVGDVEGFVDAVRRVADGGSALDPEVVSRLLGRRRRSDPLEGVTPREREVLGLMAEGRLEPRHRRESCRHGTRRGEARHVHLREARAPADPG